MYFQQRLSSYTKRNAAHVCVAPAQQGPKSDEEIARAKEAKIAKLKAANDKKAQERKKVNEFLKANERKKRVCMCMCVRIVGGCASWCSACPLYAYMCM